MARSVSALMTSKRKPAPIPKPVKSGKDLNQLVKHAVEQMIVNVPNYRLALQFFQQAWRLDPKSEELKG